MYIYKTLRCSHSNQYIAFPFVAEMTHFASGENDPTRFDPSFTSEEEAADFWRERESKETKKINSHINRKRHRVVNTF